MTTQTQKQMQKQGVRPSLREGRRAPTEVRPRAGYEMTQTVLAYCKRHNIPEPDSIAKAAVGQQTRNLLRGGYAEDDVRETALDLASRFTLFTRHSALMGLQQTVIEKYEKQRLEEHEAIVGPIANESDEDYYSALRAAAAARRAMPMPPDVAGAIGGLKRVPSKYAPRDPRPIKAALPSLRSVGQKCSCGHYAVEHGKSGCQTCDRIGRECAA